MLRFCLTFVAGAHKENRLSSSKKGQTREILQLLNKDDLQYVHVIGSMYPEMYHSDKPKCEI